MHYWFKKIMVKKDIDKNFNKTYRYLFSLREDQRGYQKAGFWTAKLYLFLG